MDPLLVAFLAYVLGCLARTVYDALFKYLEDPAMTWDQKYTITLLISIILSLILSAVTFPLDLVPSGSAAQVFLASLTMGFAVNHVVNKGVNYLASQKTTEKG
jgi:uncharacterized membrane protein YoaK (UPF0700 family)